MISTLRKGYVAEIPENFVNSFQLQKISPLAPFFSFFFVYITVSIIFNLLLPGSSYLCIGFLTYYRREAVLSNCE